MKSTKKIRTIFRNHFSLKGTTFEQKALALLLLTMPLDRIPSFDVAQITIRPSFFCIVALLYWLVREFVRGKYKINNFSLALILFSGWSLLSVMWSINATRGLRYGLFNMFMAGVAVSVAAAYQKKYQQLYINYLMLGALLVGVFGVYQYFGNYLGIPDSFTGMRSLQYGWQSFGFPRMHATFLEPLYLSAYLLLPISLLINQFIFGTKLVAQKIALPLLVLFVFCDILTLSRGGIIALIAATFVQVGLFIIMKKRISYKKAALSIAGVSCVLIFAIATIGLIARDGSDTELTGNQKGIGAFFNQLSTLRLTPNEEDILQQNSVFERAQTRDKALEIIKSDSQAFITGIGPAQYGPYIQNNKELYGWPVVNNLYIEQLVESGLIGVSFLLSAVLFVLYQALMSLRRKNYIAAAFIAYGVGISLQYLTFSALHVVHIWVCLGLLMALSTSNASKGVAHE